MLATGNCGARYLERSIPLNQRQQALDVTARHEKLL
jgi:hypothetical protein